MTNKKEEHNKMNGFESGKFDVNQMAELCVRKGWGINEALTYHNLIISRAKNSNKQC